MEEGSIKHVPSTSDLLMINRLQNAGIRVPSRRTMSNHTASFLGSLENLQALGEQDGNTPRSDMSDSPFAPSHDSTWAQCAVAVAAQLVKLSIGKECKLFDLTCGVEFSVSLSHSRKQIRVPKIVLIRRSWTWLDLSEWTYCSNFSEWTQYSFRLHDLLFCANLIPNLLYSHLYIY